MTPSVSSELSAMQQILRALAPLAVPGAAPALLLKRVLCGCCKELGPLDLGILVSRELSTHPAGREHQRPAHVALGRWGKPQGPCMCSSSVLPWAELEEGGVGYRELEGIEDSSSSSTCHLCRILSTRRKGWEGRQGLEGKVPEKGDRKGEGV